MKSRLAPWLAWALVALYIALTASGLTLSVLAGRSGVSSLEFFSDPMLGFFRLAILPIAFGIWSVIGALIVSRRPGHPIGWILCGISMIVGRR